MRKLKGIIYAILCFQLVGLTPMNGQQTITISGQLDNLQAESIVLANVYGNNQYIIDSSLVAEDGKSFSFDLVDTTIKHGLYYIVYQPSKEFFQLLIDKDQKSFSISGDASNLLETIKFKDSKQNSGFYEYIREMGRYNSKQREINKSDLSKSEKFEDLTKLEHDVQAFQQKTSDKYSGTLLSLIIRNSRTVDVPKFENEENPEMERFRYFRKHYFDFMDMDDERSVYTNTFFVKLDDFVQKYTVQHPDSVFASIDRILSQLENNKPAFRFFAAYFLNNYAKTKIMGFDEIYVKIADAYYKSGKAHWMSEENLAKVIDNADFYRHNFIDDKAHPLTIRKRDKSVFDLYEINAKSIVLIFWSPTCNHCKKELPKLEELYNKYKDESVEFITLCTKKAADCWEFVDDQNLQQGWTNAQPVSNYYKPYDIRSTPKIYILDKDKTIRFKNVDFARISQFVDVILKEEMTADSE